jgi:hypothetical protein
LQYTNFNGFNSTDKE